MATSVDSYMPYDSGPGSNVTETGWRSFMRRVGWTGVIPNVLNQFRPFGDSTGMQVKADTGEAWVEGQWGQSTSIKILPITNNTSGSPRIDLIVIRNDFVNNNIVLDIIQGTPGGFPVAPTPTQNTSKWEITLGLVAVGAGVSTITAGNVTDARAWSTTRPPLEYTGTNLLTPGSTHPEVTGVPTVTLMTCSVPDPGVPFQVSASGNYGGSGPSGSWHCNIQVGSTVISSCYPAVYSGAWSVSMPRYILPVTLTGPQTVTMVAVWDSSGASFATSALPTAMFMQVEVVPVHS